MFGIITIICGSADGLEKTLNSVANQSLKEKKHLIKDCNDKGSRKNRERFKNELLLWFSKEDNGIYDALNQAIDKNESNYIFFLHADDCFKDENVLRNIDSLFRLSDADIIYSDIEIVSKNKILRKWIAGKFFNNNIKEGWVPPHTGIFYKKEIFEKFGNFSEKYKISGDYEHLLRIFDSKINKFKLSYFNSTSILMEAGGTSNGSFKKQIIKSQEDLSILKKYSAKPYKTLIQKRLKKIKQYHLFQNFFHTFKFIRFKDRLKMYSEEIRTLKNIFFFIVNLVSLFFFQRRKRIFKNYRNLYLYCGDQLINHPSAKPFILKEYIDSLEVEFLLEEINDKDMIADIGANVGTYMIYLAKYVDKYLAFEPQKNCCQILRTNCRLNNIRNVKVIEKALTDEISKTEFVLNGTNSRIRKFNVSNSQKTVIVETDILDNYEASILKIDTEGFELDVLMGAKNLLKEKKIRIIIFKIFWGDLKNILDIKTFLEKYDFKLFRLVRSENKVITKEIDFSYVDGMKSENLVAILQSS